MTGSRTERCHRCTRTKDEGTGWSEQDHYREGRIYLHDVCPEQVCLKTVAENSRSVRSSVCGRDGKEKTEEGWLCGRHLAAYRRRRQQQEKSDEQKRANENRLAAAQRAVRLLAEAGIEAKPSYSVLEEAYDGRIVVDPDDMLRLAGLDQQEDGT